MNHWLIRGTVAVIVIASATLVWSAPSDGRDGACPGQADYVADEILVGFKKDVGEEDRIMARDTLAVRGARRFASGAERWKLPPGVQIASALTTIRANPMIDYAEPNYLACAAGQPNDPLFGALWQLLDPNSDIDIDADEAWDITTGSPSVLVAVLDSGVNYNHEDLAANMWMNPGEIAGNNLDDDLNGFVEDIHGYDFYDDDSDPMGDFNHGTACAGIIGAVGNNNVGVVGVSWNPQLVALDVMNSGGGLVSVSTVIRALEYANSVGAKITSNSYGGFAFTSQALTDAIARTNAIDGIFVAAAGNAGVDTDTSPFYPASINLANIVSVASTTSTDTKASYSNYGLVSVDLGAPGEVINYTTNLNGSYGTFNTTSAATPHVAGVAALVRSIAPAMPAEVLRLRLMDTADAIAALSTSGSTPVASGARLNARKAVQNLDTVAPAQITNLSATASTSSTITLQWTATGDDGTSNGPARHYQMKCSGSSINTSNWLGTPLVSDTEPSPAQPGTTQSMTVTGLSAGNQYYCGMRAYDEWGNGPLSNIVSCGTSGAMCVASYCKATGEILKRCTFNNTYGLCGCCNYTCVIDETCTAVDPCPQQACSGQC